MPNRITVTASGTVKQLKALQKEGWNEGSDGEVILSLEDDIPEEKILEKFYASIQKFQQTNQTLVYFWNENESRLPYSGRKLSYMYEKGSDILFVKEEEFDFYCFQCNTFYEDDELYEHNWDECGDITDFCNKCYDDMESKCCSPTPSSDDE